MPLRQASRPGFCFVCAVVEHYQDFVLFVCDASLVRERPQAGFYERFLVAGGYDDGSLEGWIRGGQTHPGKGAPASISCRPRS